MKTKLFSLFLALVASVGMMSADIKRVEIGGLYYNLNTENLTAEVTYQAFDMPGIHNYGGLTSADIPSSVTYQSKIYSVTRIGNHAFQTSSLTSITIPESVTSIGYYAFSSCGGLTYITIPNSVINIEEAAFNNCSGLASVTIPNSVTSIGENAFYWVFNIIYNGSATGSPWGARSLNGYVDGYLVYEDATKTNLLACSPAATGEIILPNSVTNIGERAFDGCRGLTTVNIPYGVTSIEKQTFWNCSSLTSIALPNSVTSIGYMAFNNCSGLTSVTIPNSVVSIGNWAFGYCTGLTPVTIPNSVTSIGENAFYWVPNIVYNGSATGSPWGAKSVNGYLDGYLIYEDATKTNLLACSSAATGEINLPNSVTSIGDYVFYFLSNITTITFGYNVTSIGNYAFAGCSGLTSISIPNSVTSIGMSAFAGCNNLTSVIIGSNVTRIGDWAFADCNQLESVFCEGANPALMTIDEWSTAGYPQPFSNTPYSMKIYVPCGFMDAYLRATGWSNYASQIKYKPYPSYIISKKAENGSISTTSNEFTICEEPFVTCTAEPNRGCYFAQWADGNVENPRIIELTQDTTMEAIFDYLLTGKCGKDNVLAWTFEPTKMALDITGMGDLSDNYTYNYQIESVVIGDEISLIGTNAFSGCNKLKNVTIGAAVKVLEEYAFYNCKSIESITCYSMRPPTVSNNALYGLDYSTIVYVPADYLNTYKMHDIWGLYDVRALDNIGSSVDNTTYTKFPKKILREGQLLILRDGKTYTVQGQELK